MSTVFLLSKDSETFRSLSVCVCVCVCVRERERERERKREREREREREIESQTPVKAVKRKLRERVDLGIRIKPMAFRLALWCSKPPSYQYPTPKPPHSTSVSSHSRQHPRCLIPQQQRSKALDDCPHPSPVRNSHDAFSTRRRVCSGTSFHWPSMNGKKLKIERT